MADRAKIELEVACLVGESLVWDERRQKLFWVDIPAKAIHCLDPASREHKVWNTPEIATSIGLRDDGGAIVGLRQTLAFWEFDDRFNEVCKVEPDRPDNRLNEGVVGPDGAYWVGTMQNNINADGSARELEAATGKIYRFRADGTIGALSDDLFGITNTMAWRSNRFITADTPSNVIYSYDWDARTGKLGDRQIWQSGFDRGLPDGSCLDSEGFLWNCRAARGGCVVRFSPDGKLDRVVELPCSTATSCAFGGPELDTLYVTTARFKMSEEHLRSMPNEGALCSFRPGVRGVVPNRFATIG